MEKKKSDQKSSSGFMLFLYKELLLTTHYFYLAPYPVPPAPHTHSEAKKKLVAPQSSDCKGYRHQRELPGQGELHRLHPHSSGEGGIHA